MAGETVRSEAVCLAIHPWSRTSHVVAWLTPSGRVTTLVKGAVRPKSFFLGQYDLNYTCDIVYYEHARGEVHALKECAVVKRRDALRETYRALVLAEYFRKVVFELAPFGPDAADWFKLICFSLDRLARGVEKPVLIEEMNRFDLSVLDLAGVLGNENFSEKPMDKARVISVYYANALDYAPDLRRQVLTMIC